MAVVNSNRTPNFVGWFLVAILLALLIASLTKCDSREPLLNLGYETSEQGNPKKMITKSKGGDIKIIQVHIETTYPCTTAVQTFLGDTLYLQIKLHPTDTIK